MNKVGRVWRGAALVAVAVLVAMTPASASNWDIDLTSLKFMGGSFDPANSITACGVTGYTPVEQGFLDGYSDAYDGGLLIEYDNNDFADLDGVGNWANNSLKVGPTPLGILQVSRTDTALKGGAILRSLIAFKNPTASQEAGMIRVTSDFGSDTTTSYNLDSSGDNVITLDDRWMITSDDPVGYPDSDPLNTTVLYGKGDVRTKSNNTTGGDGNTCLTSTMNIWVPANSTRYILLFAEMHPSTQYGSLDAEADAKAYNKVGLNEQLLAGLKPGVRAKVLNFDL